MPLHLAVERGTGFTTFHDSVELDSEHPVQFIDITELVAERVRRSSVSHGIVTVQSLHTTAALAVNENEPLLLEDLTSLLERFAPHDARYRHDDLARRHPSTPPDERPNGHAHARAVVLAASVTLHVVDGKLTRGQWQRIFLVELDGLRRRNVSILVMGVAA